MPAHYTADQVPALRREIAEWHRTRHPSMFYYQMIQLGRQPIRPDRCADHNAAAMLAADEAHRITHGDLWFLDQDLCDLLDAAHPTMPPFAPQPYDLPSREAFVVFARPLVLRAANIDAHLIKAMDEHPTPDIATAIAALVDGDIEIVGASWGPCRYRLDPAIAPAGGVFMSFYSRSRAKDNLTDPRLRAAITLPTLIVDTEAIIPWLPDNCPPDDVGRFALDADTVGAGTWRWARMVLAAFRLAAQAGLTEAATERTARPERRRTQRAGLPERDVRIVRLHRRMTEARDAASTGGTREYRNRWVVRGHWRNQWYPATEVHRPKWITPYLKGPDGAPLLGGDRVNVATGGTAPIADGSG